MADISIRPFDRILPIGPWRSTTDSHTIIRIPTPEFLRAQDTFERREFPNKPVGDYHAIPAEASALSEADKSYAASEKFPFVLKHVLDAVATTKTMAEALSVAQFSYDHPFEEIVHTTYWNSVAGGPEDSKRLVFAGLAEALNAAVQHIQTIADAAEVIRFVNNLQGRSAGKDFEKLQDKTSQDAVFMLAKDLRDPEDMRALARELPQDLPGSKFTRDSQEDRAWHVIEGGR
jgi:hypothetical protein